MCPVLGPGAGFQPALPDVQTSDQVSFHDSKPVQHVSFRADLILSMAMPPECLLQAPAP